ncbi:hypothetical protein A2721_03155 [Candidatus Gottesmanbacteria bacterium RIFCSPHIGHO2_01_FULL_47_48]|uniref:Ribbon-helix-helix protein CopG domain-containing protein n=1 Tax=Candidatus Gottesmanbacteria bacterium RIFCSPHIGHO2_01_FULL_47_48 TaxID=1798381 RepID=A0A1F5ZZA3_9BACT|nr:MAG: hypothetical protein A2721_03155 [Candidatus Gottesmanbacteria bacterium RIFCSPHIGHO2_01_FULL_47_48]
MNTTVRTTITLPTDLYEELRKEAFLKRSSVSHVVATRIKKPQLGKKAKKFGFSLDNIIGKYHVKKWREITKKELYDDIAKHKMSLGF